MSGRAGADRRKTSIIVVLKGTEGSSPTIGRTEGFGQIAALHENWKILEQADGEFTTAKAREEMEPSADKI